MFAQLDQKGSRGECLFFGTQNSLNMESVWHSHFISDETILSLSNIFVNRKSYMKMMLFVTNRSRLICTMYIEMTNTETYRSSPVESKC